MKASVDDDAGVRLSARAMLEELGHEVVEATGGADALAFRYALKKAHAEAAQGVLERIAQRLTEMPLTAAAVAEIDPGTESA